MRFPWVKPKLNLQDEETVETSFLVPIREDVEAGNGELHSSELWEVLTLLLWTLFDGQTQPHSTYEGSWMDPTTGKVFKDESRKFIIAVKRKDLARLKGLIQIAAIMFKQKCIYFVYEGKVDYVYSNERRWK
jgi:hypothetical protein